jgi:polyadenylate-binding protein
VSAAALAELNPEQRKARLGLALLPLVQKHQPILAVHVTKELLELDDDEVLFLLENDSHLERKIGEVTTELAQRQGE